MRKRRLHAVERPLEHHRQAGVEAVEIEIGHVPTGRCRGVVEDHVDTAVVADAPIDRSPHLIGIGDIAMHIGDRPADVGHHLSATLVVDVRRNHCRTLAT